MTKSNCDENCVKTFNTCRHKKRKEQFKTLKSSQNEVDIMCKLYINSLYLCLRAITKQKCNSSNFSESKCLCLFFFFCLLKVERKLATKTMVILILYITYLSLFHNIFIKTSYAIYRYLRNNSFAAYIAYMLAYVSAQTLETYNSKLINALLCEP